jgi:glycine cleavage system H protein
MQSIGTVGHVWVNMEQGKVRIGITDYGQRQLKEIMFVEIPERGSTVQALIYDGKIPKSKPIGAVESQKTSIELFCPISGTIAEINDEIENNPSLINQDPYADGWILLINPSNWEKEKELLWSAEIYARELEKL